MAGTQYQVRTYGDTIVSRKLTRLMYRAMDLRPAWPGVAEIVARGFSRSFDQEGPGWTPLKPATQRRRVAEGYGGTSPIRERTGKDRRNMTDPEQLLSDARQDRHAIDFWVMEDTPAMFHQEGWTSRGGRDVAARPLKLTRYYQDQISKHIQDILMEAYRDG